MTDILLGLPFVADAILVGLYLFPRAQYAILNRANRLRGRFNDEG